MFWDVLVAEQSKVFKRKILWVEIAIITALVGLALGGPYLIAPDPSMVERVLWPNGVVLTLSQFAANPTLAGLILVVLIGAVVSQEYTWRTLQLVLSRGISRSTLVGAKFASLALPALLVVVIPTLVGLVLSGFFTYQTKGTLDPSVFNYPQVVLGFLYGAYTLLPYAALAFALAIISRSSVTAIGIGVGVLLGEAIVWQVLVGFGGAAAQVALYLPMSLSMSVLSLTTAIAAGANVPADVTAGGAAGSLLAPFTAAVVIAIYTVVLVAVAAIAFRRQDLTG
ncbi:MAG: ABC transporter permease subunit [Chloroflexota bacterium]